MEQTTHKAGGIACAWVAIALWSLAYVLTKVALRYYDPFSFSVFRYLAAGVFAAVLLAVRREKRPRKQDLPLIVLLGFFGFTFYVLTYNYGAPMVSVATAALIIATAPVATAVGAAVFYHERMGRVQLAATLIEIIGMLVCLWDGGFSLNAGVWLIVLSMLSFTAYNLLTRLLVHRYTPFQLTEYSLLTAALTFLPLSPAAFRRTQQFSWAGLAVVFATGFLCSGAAYIAWSEAMKRTDGTARVANLLFLEPVVTGILGYLLLREVPGVQTAVGGAIVLLGLFVFGRGGVKNPINSEGERKQ